MRREVMLGIGLVWALAGAACGGGGGGSSSVPPAQDPPAQVAISGQVSFDLVPVLIEGDEIRLDYASTQAMPARGVTVQLIRASDGATVLASARTDSAGAYALAAPAEVAVFLRVVAELTPATGSAWDVRVVDNTRGDALYVLEGADFQTAVPSVRNLHAASGWNGAAYAGPRAAAPFAILDVIYEAMALVRSAEPDIDFPPLAVHWSADNTPSFTLDGEFDPAAGFIGTSFYAPQLGMFLLGAEDIDTDEYDRHVIAHEWSHFYETALSRSDSLGGPHALGDQLDLRVAFAEGWGNAFSGMATGQSRYRDALGASQASGFDFDLESEDPGNAAPGWFSEQSVQQLLYDFFDSGAEDPVTLGFGPLHAVLTVDQRTTPALTSLFPFVAALKQAAPDQALAIDALVAAQQIDPVADAYGGTETHAGFPASADVLPVYAELDVNGAPVQVCSTDAFSSTITDSINKLGSRRLLRFTAATAGTYTFRATTVSAPATTDPDFRLHRAGPLLPACLLPTDDCPWESSTPDREEFSWPLLPGEHVLEVYEYSNTQARASATPPIGRACFAVAVSGP